MPFSIVWIWICELYVAVTGRRTRMNVVNANVNTLTQSVTHQGPSWCRVVPALRTWPGLAWPGLQLPPIINMFLNPSWPALSRLGLAFCYRMQNYLAMLHVVNNFKIRFPQVWRKHERAAWERDFLPAPSLARTSWRVRVLIAVDCNAPLKAATPTATADCDCSANCSPDNCCAITQKTYGHATFRRFCGQFGVGDRAGDGNGEGDEGIFESAERRLNSHHASAAAAAVLGFDFVLNHAMHMNYFCSSVSSCAPSASAAPSSWLKINVDANTCM